MFELLILFGSHGVHHREKIKYPTVIFRVARIAKAVSKREIASSHSDDDDHDD
jgi:hypothetical protein